MSRKFISLSVGLLAGTGIAVWMGFRGDVTPSPVTTLPVNTSTGHRERVNSHSQAAKSRWSGIAENGLPVRDRLEIARRIATDTLGKEDEEVLFALMRNVPRTGGENDWYLVVNEVMEQMRRRGVGSDQYSARLSDLIADPSQADVVRDYAIQHLTAWIGPVDPEHSPHEENPDSIRLALAKIAATIQDPSVAHSTIPGTGLNSLAQATPNMPADVADAAWKSLGPYLQGVISGDPQAQLSTRVSAIQAVSITDQQQFLPLIRSFATSETTEPSIRLSSIASLGFFANPNDKALLDTLAVSKSRYQYAAQSALKRLASR
jgi:hypothetical protein